MSFEPPEGILDIGNATLRVGKLEVAETSGLNQGLLNIVKNNILINENIEYSSSNTWGIKLPTTWVAEFDVKGHSEKYVEFNFYNEDKTSNALGYVLNFKDTTMSLMYDTSLSGDQNILTTATIPTIVGAYRKVNIFFERGVISVSIDGTRYLYFKESDGYNAVHGHPGVASRVVSTTGGAFVNVFIESDNENNSKFKNLRIVNGRFISDKTSNIAFIGGNLGVGVHSPKEALDIRGNMHLTRVSNVSQVSVDSNVVTEYTGPHDRPLRKYPEVKFPTQASGDIGATTVTYNGYTLTSSTTYNFTNHNLTNALDGLTNTTWSGNLGNYTTTGVPESTTRGGLGDYIQLELPNAIKIQHTKIFSQETTGYSNGPRDITLYGSNNGTDWTSIKVATDLPLDGEALNTTVHVNSVTFYRYFRLEINKIWIDSGNATYPRIAEWELYGYEEGSGSLDTTLKSVYNVPATTGTQLEVYYDGQDYSSGSTITDKVANANATISSGSDITFDSTWKAWTFSSSTTRTQTIKTGTLPTSLTSSSSISAALWFKFGTVMGDRAIFHIADPQANRTANQILEIRGNVSQDYRFQLWDGQYTWQFNPPFFNNNSYDIPTGEWYHLAMSITDSSINGRKLYFNGVECDLVDGSRLTATSASELNLPSDAVLELGRRPGEGVGNTVHDAGNEFDGSIANFRLYSKALNAGQVQELYDYQKDYFLGSKSQVTLYKGHLGVGVTEPSGQLELAGDERIQEYPPGPMGGYETLIPGHGVFCVDFANWYSGNTPWGMYKKNNDVGGQENVWYGPYQNNNGYSGGNVYTGTDFAASTTSGLFLDDVDGARYYGAWTTIAMPYDIYLKQIHIHQGGSSVGSSTSCAPEDGVILGSNDGTKWYHVHTFTGLQYGGTAGTSSYSAAGEGVVVNAKRPYSHYALITTRTHHNDFTVIIGELRWYGTPGSTTLDKGSLTLGRSLDVPRVSRYDVDTETPRPEKLVLDFDTSAKGHSTGATDISGRGNHGCLKNGAYYSTGDKAFILDGASGSSADYIQSAPLGFTGDQVHSVSLWFWSDKTHASLGSNEHGLYGTGAGSSATNDLGGRGGLSCYNSPRFRYWKSGSGGKDFGNATFEQFTWTHCVLVYPGGGPSNARLFLNGVEQLGVMDSGNDGNYSFVGSDDLLIGDWYNSDGSGAKATTPWDGKISNFKLYEVALENSEVKKLYNLGRTGRSMVISDTAVGIGKVPEAQLDVRGNLKVSGTISSNSPGWSYWRAFSQDINTAIYNSATDGPLGGFNTLAGHGQNWETGISGTISSRGTGGNFNPTTGVYTAPEKGVYMLNFSMSIDGGLGSDDSMYMQFTIAGNADGGDWETGGAFINRATSTNSFMLLNPQFSTRAGIETAYAMSDIVLLDAGARVNVRFENVSASSPLSLQRCNFSGFKIA